MRYFYSLFLVLIAQMALAPSALAEEGRADAAIGAVNGFLAQIFFFDIFFGAMPGEMPFIVAWLVVGAVYLTFRFGFINLRMMGHAYQIIRGKYHSKDDKGEVTPFQALATAMSATVGLGNIAGVAIAVMIGGPGAVFWMIVAGFFGMTTKFTEVTLAQMYREFRADGHVLGGPMEYLSKGFAEKGMPATGRVLAILFAVLTVGGALGAGNMFQVSQAMGAVKNEIPFFDGNEWVFGIIMAVAVGLVVIGGIKRIAHAAEAIVPTMVLIYMAACLWIVLSHIGQVPAALSLIVAEAFAPTAVAGGIIGAIVQGFKRAAFSSEAGIGSAAIAHSAACVKYPVRQGFVALYEPFIDTVVICTMTALVIIITGVYADPEHAALIAAREGAALTAAAFGTVIAWFPIILSLSVVLFAYSTMIAWFYYGERSWTFMFGERFSMVFRVIFVAFVMVASIASAGNILDFSDLLILAMAFPNLLALYLLQGKVSDALKEYLAKLRSGELDRENG